MEKECEIVYDKKTDILFLQIVPRVPEVSVDLGGNLWLRINPLNGELVGIEIEDYKEYFVKKYLKKVGK